MVEAPSSARITSENAPTVSQEIAFFTQHFRFDILLNSEKSEDPECVGRYSHSNGRVDARCKLCFVMRNPKSDSTLLLVFRMHSLYCSFSSQTCKH